MEFYILKPIESISSPRFNSQRDGILPEAGSSADVISVSIPNGMEFYMRIIRLLSIIALVSIPNGMEFYISLYLSLIVLRMFQFPTGWNSTKLRLRRRETGKSFQFPTGWNSTPICPAFALAAIVSIPNGMEFYLISYMNVLSVIRFNSQRDGILRLGLLTVLCDIDRFQFPTGWNSTGLRKRHKFLILVGFNSQRDGILLKSSCYRSIGAHRFQFPTGWNSTVPLLRLLSARRKFQFPTGWNSTLKTRWKLSERLVSIPNGMEFYA